jgi:hypothetical protein
MIKKKLLSTFYLVLFTLGVKAQTPPNAFNYSAVARNASGQPIVNATIGIQISILKTSPTGTSQYSENHFVNTDAFGLFNLVIGAGALQSGSIATIDWSIDDYYLKVGMDAAGGSSFLTMGTTQLLSVPFALYAKSAGSVSASNNPSTFFLVAGTGQVASSVLQKITLSSSIENIYNPNEDYNVLTDEYSVPEDGNYQFTISMVGAGTFIIRKNGIDQILLPNGGNSTSCAFGCHDRRVILINLVAGDIITFWADGWSDLGGPYTNFVGSIYSYKIE